jgi:hypothetical protein
MVMWQNIELITITALYETVWYDVWLMKHQYIQVMFLCNIVFLLFITFFSNRIYEEICIASNFIIYALSILLDWSSQEERAV